MKLLVIVLLIISNTVYAQSKQELVTQIRLEARKQGLDENIALAVAMVESNLNPAARGEYGEIGVFQIRPEYAQIAVYSPKDNIKEGVRQLLYWSRECPVKEFVVCYNQGKRHPKYPQLHPYFKKVSKQLAVLR